MRHTHVALISALALFCGPTPGALANGGGCMADLDGCGSVDVADLLQLLSSYGLCPGGDCPADFDGNGSVGGEDLGYLFGHWGGCSEDLPFPQPAAIEIVIVEITDPVTMDLGLREFDLFVPFENPTDRLLNVFDANASCDDAVCFAQPLPGGVLPLPELIWDIFELTYDSFVTIGAQFEDIEIFSDPNLVADDFTSGASLGIDAGWATTPSSPLGVAGNYPDNQIRVATFTTPRGAIVHGQLSLIYQDDTDTMFTATIAFELNAGSCPWDCGGDNDNAVGIVDFLALLAQWGQEDTSCDFNNHVIGIIEFLGLLANWGPCPR